VCLSVILLDDYCNVLDNTCVILDFFGDECSDDAAEECSEFRPVVPLSRRFDSDAFNAYCRYLIFDSEWLYHFA